MSALAAAPKDSKGSVALRWGIRGGFALLAVAGAGLLVWAEFSPLYQVTVGQVVKKVGDTGPHHGYALIPIAVAALVMTFGAVRSGSRPALVALGVLGLVALLIAVLVDRPDTSATGFLGQVYEAAKATPRAGLTRELIGGGLLALAAVLGLLTRDTWAHGRAAHPLPPS